MISYFFKMIGLITTIAGVANLYSSFTDKWIMVGGVFVYFFGCLIGGKESFEKKMTESKPKKSGFQERLELALKDQKDKREKFNSN